MLKDVDGAWDLATLTVCPSLSTAVGSTQETKAEDAPGTAVAEAPAGQLLMTGAVVSVPGVPAMKWKDRNINNNSGFLWNAHVRHSVLQYAAHETRNTGTNPFSFP